MTATSAASLESMAAYQRVGDAATVRIEAAARGLDAVLGPFKARCTEYPLHATDQLAARLSAHAFHERELVAHVAATARAFQTADSGWLGALLPNFMRAWQHRTQYGRDAPTRLSWLLSRELSARLALLPPLQATRVIDSYRSVSWNWTAFRLIKMLNLTNRVNALSSTRWPLTLPLLGFVLAVPALFCGTDALRLVVMGDLPRWSTQPINAPQDVLRLALQGLWYESMEYLDPQLFVDLSRELDRLNLSTCTELERCTLAGRAPDVAERLLDPHTGALAVQTGEVFPLTGLFNNQRFYPLPAESMRGEHSAISYHPGEQVRFERLNAERGDYRISIAGLNPEQPGAPNNFTAVALTADGIVEQNHYYAEVRARFLADLERIPPGSVLHLQGHSLGGGMCFLLRNDPLVQDRLRAAGIVVGSLITFGAVRPRGPAGANQTHERDDPFASADQRHYVNSDDSLARNVGAGHAGFENVILLENNAVDEPTAAHSAYDQPQNYAALPPALRIMPYMVDPETHTVYAPGERMREGT
jgi:hypothetical protein